MKLKKDENVLVLNIFLDSKYINVYKAKVKGNGAKTISVTYEDGDGERFYHCMLGKRSLQRIIRPEELETEIKKIEDEFGLSFSVKD